MRTWFGWLVCCCQVAVHTSDIRGAGTDANVHLLVFGTLGDSGQQPLENSANNFERNKADVFHFQCPDLGAVQRIQIGHDNRCKPKGVTSYRRTGRRSWVGRLQMSGGIHHVPHM
jgi:hypothetical protein